MAIVVTVDDRCRVKLPKDMVKPGDKVLVICAGTRIILIPIPPRPIDASGKWIKVKVSRRELKKIIEEEALKEVKEKLERRCKHADRD